MPGAGLVSTTFRSLRTRNYRLFTYGQVASLTGTWMQTIAQGWLVLQLSHDNGVAVGLVTALQFLPILLGGVWGGVVADRFDKRRVLIGTQSAMAVTATVLATITLTGVVELWMVYALALLTGIATTVDTPTRQSFISEMAGPEDVANAVALNSAMFQAARVTGPALAGVVIVLSGTGACFVVNALSFLAVIGALVAMRPAELHRLAPVERSRGQIREGLRYVWSLPDLRTVLWYVGITGIVAGNVPVILPIFAKVTFHGSAGAYSLLTGAMGIGALIGALFAARRSVPTARFAALCGFGVAVAGFAAALSPSLPVLVLVLLPTGACQTALFATCNSMVQLRAARWVRGRVMSVWTTFTIGGVAIGGPVVGWVCQTLGPRWGFGLGATAMLAAAARFGSSPARVAVQEAKTAVRAQEGLVPDAVASVG
jgi:MFS family permease